MLVLLDGKRETLWDLFINNFLDSINGSFPVITETPTYEVLVKFLIH